MPFQNYVVMTTSISSIKVAEGKFEAKGLVDKMPLILKGDQKLSKYFAEGEVKTFMGEIRYNEFTRHSGEKVQQLVLLVRRVEAPPADGKKRNFAHLTVMVASDCIAEYAPKTGALWAHTRAFKSMGKKPDGNYRPSLWLTLKAFTTKEGDETLPYAVGGLAKGMFVEVKGPFQYEEYEGRPQFSLVVRKLESNPDLSPRAADTSAAGAEREEVSASEQEENIPF